MCVCTVPKNIYIYFFLIRENWSNFLKRNILHLHTFFIISLPYLDSLNDFQMIALPSHSSSSLTCGPHLAVSTGGVILIWKILNIPHFS